MGQQGKELNILVRHVPRLVVARYLRCPERMEEPESTTFTAVIALFDISGFSSLGSQLQEDERNRMLANHGSNTKPSDHPGGGNNSDGPSASGLRSPGDGNASIATNNNNNNNNNNNSNSAAGSRSHSPRRRNGSIGHSKVEAAVPESSDRSDVTPRELMRQRRQSATIITRVATSNSINAHGTTAHHVGSPTATSKSPLSSPRALVSTMSRAKPLAPQGIAVEMLTMTLNQTLEPVIDVILRHGGDIIKFAGDALIVVWETEATEGIATAPGILVHRATTCALEALRVLHESAQQNGHTAILGMHVGLGVSQVTGNHVGGVLDRWEFYLSGDANRQMSLAEQDAAKGQLALSPEAFSAFQGIAALQDVHLDVIETDRGNFVVEGMSRLASRALSRRILPNTIARANSGGTIAMGYSSSAGPLSPRAPQPLQPDTSLIPFLRSYVPGPITSFLRKGLAIQPSSRTVTVAFLRLDRLAEVTCPHDQLLAIHQSLVLIQEAVYKVQGTLRQFVIDDKGAVAIVVIGLPPLYHENNALRGVKCAEYLLRKGLAASIGSVVAGDQLITAPSVDNSPPSITVLRIHSITTGNAYCGSVGSSARAEYAVVGDIINLAARLMTAAQTGEILCDKTTRDECKDSITYAPPREIVVKGKADKVRIFPVARLAHPHPTGLSHETWLNTVRPLPYGSEHVVRAVPVYGSVSHRGKTIADSENPNNRSVKTANSSGGGGSSNNSNNNNNNDNDNDGIAPRNQDRVLIVTGVSGTGKTMLLHHFKHSHTRCFLGSGDPVDCASELHAWSGIIREMISRTVKTPKRTNSTLVPNTSSPVEPRLSDTDAKLEMTELTIQEAESLVESILAEGEKPQKQKQSSFTASSVPLGLPLRITRAMSMPRRDPRLTSLTTELGGSDGRRNSGKVPFTKRMSWMDRATRRKRSSLLSDGSSRGSNTSNSRATGNAQDDTNDTDEPASERRAVGSLKLSCVRMPVMEFLIMKNRVEPDMVPILNDLLPFDQLFPGSLDALPRGEERTRALEAIIFSIVEAISMYKPVLLLFDNAQWVDDASWTLLLRMLNELPHVNALITSRVQPKHCVPQQRWYKMFQHLPTMKHVELRCFTYQATALFLCQHYHITIMDTQVLDFVFARTNGNPAELIKLMDMLVLSNHIEIDRTSGTIVILSDLDYLDMQVPQYTRARVMACVDSLGSIAQMALKVISVHPEPADENMLSGILTLFLTTEYDSSEGVASLAAAIKRSRSNSATQSVLHQVRLGLADCESDTIVTLDNVTHSIYFNSDEMRLVVYDTMLPSQREMIHMLYSQWFKQITKQASHQRLGETIDSNKDNNKNNITRASCTSSSTTPSLEQSAKDAQSHQNYAMLGYHLARSGHSKASLEAYQRAAEHALEKRDFAFATDCMHSASRILDDGDGPRCTARSIQLSELDCIVSRSKVEFLRGAIAIEMSNWDQASAHMAAIVQLCLCKGTVLRRYSSSVFLKQSVRDSFNTTIAATRISISINTTEAVPTNTGIASDLALPSTNTPPRCLPRFFNYKRLLPFRTSMPRLLRGNRLVPRRSTFNILVGSAGSNRRLTPSSFFRSPLSPSTAHVQPEEVMQALQQIIFYKKKAELLIKKISVSKRKQEDMSHEIQKLTKQSLKTKQKRW